MVAAQGNVVLKARMLQELHHSSKIFNVDKFGPTINVHCDMRGLELFRLLRVYNVDTDEDVAKYEWDEAHRGWVTISPYYLDLEVGRHTYALEFINTATSDTVTRYFVYKIQDDHPDKPYIYMTR